jgi:hypothetical protein
MANFWQKDFNEALQERRIQHYLDRIIAIMLKPSFEGAQSGENARRIARAITLEVLIGLDPLRKGRIVRFLYEAGMIAGEAGEDGVGKAPVIPLHGADLIDVALEGANLGWVNLCGVYLNRAKLRGAYLAGANLGGVDLIQADLSGATLTNANLMLADLRDADFKDVDLRDVTVMAAQLSTAKNVPVAKKSQGMSGSFGSGGA